MRGEERAGAAGTLVIVEGRLLSRKLGDSYTGRLTT